MVVYITKNWKFSRGLLIWYVREISRQTDICYPLIRTCAYQGVRNARFSENFANLLSE